ncbi:MAG: DUF222 domain-containing protein [Galbitalea sp.]
MREEERRARRSLRLFVQPDGMTRLVWVMDPETAATVREVADRATSPKLGGVRFVDPERQAHAERIFHDDRTAEQLASDAFEQLLRLGADADPGVLLGSGAPVIRVTTTATAIESGIGLGRIDGQSAPVSTATVRRLTCSGIAHDIVFDVSLRALDVGRDQRLFTAKQREALAVIWGGCVAEGCDRPPSWCEAHHIDHWLRDHGKTDAADGVLLCKHHHLALHNLGWEIDRQPDGTYWLSRPDPLDPGGAPTRTRLVPNNGNLRDLARDR